MFLLLPFASAHDAPLPHVHPSDPAGVALILAWALAGVAFLGWAAAREGHFLRG